MGHYESTQLRTGFWGSASLRDSSLLPPWASPIALFPLRSLCGERECCADCKPERLCTPFPSVLGETEPQL